MNQQLRGAASSGFTTTTINHRHHHLCLELGKRPVRGLVGVGYGDPLGFVGGQPLRPARHPLGVRRLGGLVDVLLRPARVPRVELFVLVSTDVRVGLK